MKKQLVIAGAVAVVGTAAAATGAYAVSTTAVQPGSAHMSSLVDAIAAKFNLKKDDVQKVFDDNRTQMEQKRNQAVKDQLAQLVKDGKLTQAQADAITAKRAELEKQRQDERGSMQNKSESDRQATMQQHRTELDQWLKDNAIDSQYAYLLMGGGHGHGH